VDESEPGAAFGAELVRGTDCPATDPGATEITLICSNCWRVSPASSHSVNEVARCTRCGARLRVRLPYPHDTPVN